LKTSHSRTLSSLLSGTAYHFRITVVDSDGNTVIGKDRTFTTSAVTPAPISSSTTSTSTTTTTTSATTTVTTTTATTTNSSDTLADITERRLRTSDSGSKVIGGLPVIASRPLLERVTPLDGQVVFDWRKGVGLSNGTVYTLIVRKQGKTLVQSRIDGEIVYNGPATTFTDTGLQNGVEYHYALYSYGAFGRFTTPAQFKVVTQANKTEVHIPSANIKEELTPAPILARDLFLGKKGDDVKRLQIYLAKHRHYPEGRITGYFGVLTQKAVIRFQKLNNIFPNVGYVGSITRDVLAQ
jgi:hypothetical protein